MTAFIIFANIGLLIFVISWATLVSAKRHENFLKFLKDEIKPELWERLKKRAQKQSASSMAWLIFGFVVAAGCAFGAADQYHEATKHVSYRNF